MKIIYKEFALKAAHSEFVSSQTKAESSDPQADSGGC